MNNQSITFGNLADNPVDFTQTNMTAPYRFIWHKLFTQSNGLAWAIFISLGVLLGGRVYFLSDVLTDSALMGLLGTFFVLDMTIFLLVSYVLQQRQHIIDSHCTLHQCVWNETQKIRSHEERLELALQGANEGVWDKNLESGEIYLSPRCKALLGYTEHELPDSEEEWLKRVHPEDIDLIRFNETLYLKRKTGFFRQEYRLKHKDGHYIWVSERGMMVLNAENKIVRLVGVMSDISERRRIERLKSEFLSTVSHELRTPLTSIIASLNLLEAEIFGALPTKASNLVTIASKNSKRLAELVNDVLDIEKLLSGKALLRSDEIDLIALVKQSIELNFDVTSSFGVSVTFSATSDARHVVGDKERLLQVLGHLLSNAAKFSTQGGVVDVRVTQEDKVARVEIIDHGVGIAPEFQNRIFDEFVQADMSDRRRQGGTGLGLSITKRVVEKMGGEIGYASELGKGSTFWFTIPSSLAWNFSVDRS